jgi:hypothetical protein
MMLAADDVISVGRVLSAWTTADVQNHELKVTYSVYNQQASEVTGTQLTTRLQPGVTFKSATQLPNQNGQALTWSLGTITPFGRVSVEMTVSFVGAIPLVLDDGAEALGTVDARAVSDTAPDALLRSSPISASLLSSTPDANSTDPYIQAKAAELNQNPAEIFAFVRDSIAYESYTGSLRGARGTLWSGAGNSLDQSSLMIALLRASGIESQYARGTLPPSLAQDLIESMFTEPLRVTGFIPEDATLSDPANDPVLLTETQDHYWVQFDVGAGLQDADPSFRGALINQTFTTVNATLDEINNDQRHKVRLRLDREIANTASTLFGGQVSLDRAIVLDTTFDAVELTGRPLSIGHFVNTHRLGAIIFSSVTNVYSPYIAVGDYAHPIAQDELVRGTDYQEVLTNFPFGTQVLTGLFLTIDVSGPGRITESHERPLLDRIGFDVRTNGGMPNIDFGPDGQPALAPTDIFTVNVATGITFSGVAASLMKEIAGLQQELIDAQASGVALTPAQSDAVRQTAIGVSRLNALNYFALSDQDTPRLADFFQVRAYTAQPRINITSAGLRIDDATDAASLAMRLDLRSNRIRVIARPGQNVEAVRVYQFTRGVRENSIETAVIEQQSISVGDTRPIVSTANIFAAADAQDIPLMFVSSSNANQLNGLDISDEAKARISQAIDDDLIVLVPTRSVALGGSSTTAWYQIDSETGESIGVTEDGGHAAIAEFSFMQAIIGVEIGILQSVLIVLGNALFNPDCQAGANLKACREIINNSNNGLTVVSAGQAAAGIAGGAAAAGPTGLFIVIGGL